jgi:multidrug resistance efflux pump
MALFVCEMLGVHALVQAASDAACCVMRRQARADLMRLGILAQTRCLSREEKHTCDVALETLVALDMRENPAKHHSASQYRETLKQFYLPISPTQPYYHA